MNRIGEHDWSFDSIRAVDEKRAARLESVGPPDALVRTLAIALNEAMDRGDVRIAVDSKGNNFIERRTIVQFQTPPTHYDWLFNARTGYRAQFWIDPVVGIAFNTKIVESLAEVLTKRLSQMLTARRIEVQMDDGSRQERDTGTIEIASDEVARSLAPAATKIWIGERLYSVDDESITNIGLAVLSDARRSRAKLRVPRWAEALNAKTGEKGEELRAPYPETECSWLDMKGGFLDAEGKPDQIKRQDERARQISERGWT